MAEVAIRAGLVADAEALRRLGEAVVPATYAPINAAYADMMMRGWWATGRLAASLDRLPHAVAEVDGQVVGVANQGDVAGQRCVSDVLRAGNRRSVTAVPGPSASHPTRRQP